MRIPYENRVDRYDVEWKTVEGDNKSFQYAVISITELWGIGHLTFKEPLKVEVFFGDNEDKSALAIYDFGMEERIATEKEKNFLYNYGLPNESVEPIKTVFSTIKFDLMHAFFHYNGDPNYGPTHWALAGWLKDRCEAEDDFIWEDIQFEEAKK